MILFIISCYSSNLILTLSYYIYRCNLIIFYYFIHSVIIAITYFSHSRNILFITDVINTNHPKSSFFRSFSCMKRIFKCYYIFRFCLQSLCCFQINFRLIFSGSYFCTGINPLKIFLSSAASTSSLFPEVATTILICCLLIHSSVSFTPGFKGASKR